MEGVLNQEDDNIVWFHSSNGNSQLKLAWNMCRNKNVALGFAKNVWHHCVPLKWSFLLWKALRACFPLDDCLVKLGFCIVSRCGCCCYYIETTSHVFVNSEIARQVWGHFEDLCHINCNGTFLQQRLILCGSKRLGLLAIKPYYLLLQYVIYWELWLNRNGGKYEGKTRIANQIILNVKSSLGAILFGHPLLKKRSFADTFILQQLHIFVPTFIGNAWSLIRSPS